jgi:hypothetical protein
VPYLLSNYDLLEEAERVLGLEGFSNELVKRGKAPLLAVGMKVKVLIQNAPLERLLLESLGQYIFILCLLVHKVDHCDSVGL